MATGDDERLLPEQRARVRIDAMLDAAGWVVQDQRSVNLYAGTGVAVRELTTDAGPADYVLFINRQAVGVIEAKRQGTTGDRATGRPSRNSRPPTPQPLATR